VTAQCEPDGATADAVLAQMKAQIEAITLPEGYTMEWGGDHEDARKAEHSVFVELPVAMMGMALVVVLLFNAFRQPLIIALILPLSGIGVTAGLLLTGQPFGFMAMLGALSLFGMLIKNAVVLIDQIDLDIRSGTEAYEAIVESSVSRLRPVMMASMTTVLAMIPLVTDRLFGAMAVTIMSGLTFATVLTLVVVPVLYAMFFKVHAPPK
jgi:multidrug efflux pump subunit AcrB